MVGGSAHVERARVQGWSRAPPFLPQLTPVGVAGAAVRTWQCVIGLGHDKTKLTSRVEKEGQALSK